MKGFICLLLVFLTTTAGAQNAKGKRPNMIFIMSDDHAYQAISAYGYGLNKTPNIDLLATRGMRFNRAFVNNSLCAPSRAAIITGKYSHLNGIMGNGTERFDSSQTTFPKLLQQAGYQTALIGKWHLNSEPTGFNYWNILPGQGLYYNPDFIDSTGRKKVEGYATDLTTDYALQWLDNRDTTKPFCILVWNKAPHRNWLPALKYLHEFDDTDIPLPATFFDDYNTRTRAAHEQQMEISKWLAPNYDLKENLLLNKASERLDSNWINIYARLSPSEQQAYDEAYTPKNNAFKAEKLQGSELAKWKYERYIKDYLRCIQSVDDNVGRINQWLQDNKLDSNTIVIYTSDQGFYLGEHGWFDKRFMYEESFRTPLIISWPDVIKPGSVTDKLVMNLDIPETLLASAGATIPGNMQGESLLPILENGDSATWRKYVYYHYYESGGEHNVAKHIGIRSERYKLIYFYENKEWELYDLKNDPSELNNIYDKPAGKKIRVDLKKELWIQMKKYKDHI